VNPLKVWLTKQEAAVRICYTSVRSVDRYLAEHPDIRRVVRRRGRHVTELVNRLDIDESLTPVNEQRKRA